MSRVTKAEQFERRRGRVRARVHGTALRPRLAVFLSKNHVYAQLIDDQAGKTLAAFSDQATSEKAKKESKTSRASRVGTGLAQKAVESGIQQVVFDKSGFAFHGSIKALAEAARVAGLKF